MTSLTTLLFLPLSLLALYHSTTTTEARAASENKEAMAVHKRSAPIPNLAELMRRRRSFEASLRGPPSNFQEEDSNQRLRKRQEDLWIWMPAHGYIPMPKDESYNEEDEQDTGIGNLLRYG